MTRCSILECKNNSSTKNLQHSGVSYHRFPKDPYLKEKWIAATGRINWMPTKSSCICSDHFAENEILITKKGYRYIDSNVIPTKKVMSYQDESIASSSKKSILEEPETSSEPPTKKTCIKMDKLQKESPKKNIMIYQDESIASSSKKSILEEPETSSEPRTKKTSIKMDKLQKESPKKTIMICQDETMASSSKKSIIKEPGPISEPSRDQLQKDSVTIITPAYDIITKSHEASFANKSPSSSLYSTPRKKKLCGMLRWTKNTITKKDLKIKRLQTQNRRLKRKLENMEQLLRTLEEKFCISYENLTCLKYTNVEVQELIARQVKSGESGFISKRKYSPELRCFALTLHFYSPKAYDYVRNTFNTCLPHSRTLRKWYSKVGGVPGFTKESFAALKLKAESCSQPIVAALVIDEMSIRRRIEWDGQKLHGYVDMGTGLEGDHLAEAKEALVFLVTAINSNFKVPIAFFLVDGVSGVQRAELIKQGLELIHESGILIVALTFDGCAANISMANHLGCNFQTSEVKFPHPVTNDSVVVILDPCHMIKLLRNSFEFFKILIDKDGKKILWNYLSLLNNQQRIETFHLANKLRDRHINFKNQRMKVKLATQLFSQSVAEAIKFCRTDLKINEFKDSEPTENFLLIINNIFDIFNSRNLYFYGFKKALNSNNVSVIFQYLSMASEYISNLKLQDGSLLINSTRKTGFLGFLGCIEAIKYFYKSLIESKILLFLPFYKLSQDHLELLFCNIRCHGGSNNNPTARQFVAAYKKILVHVELQNTDKGNCTSLEKISILNCSSAVERINKTTAREINEPDDDDDIEVFLEFAEVGEHLSEFGNQAIGHIGGYIVRNLLKKIKCNICVNGLVTDEISYFHKFIVAKDKGGLLYPSPDVFKICQISELCLKACWENNMLKKQIIYNKILRQLIGINLFDSISYHQIGEFPSSNHITDLIKCIIERYVNTRLHHLLKLSVPVSKRQLFNKLILFEGQ